ncbi:hypothetical protein DFH11DRAFT_1568837 [Phellopilus nigrolimitatus]|nr:hypothetical protein DFH11DRAFT_1568837 [Phellopilus nigrolimitatus]
MAQHEGAPVDLEALQAQIDLSMALADELVASWVKPAFKTGASKRTARDTEKELEEYLRRPPRLGLGAPLPESAGPAARENAKLKNKLVGNEKKRRRDDAVAVDKPIGEDADDDEEEGRKGESSTKKVRLDPFSAPKKNKGKSKEGSLNEVESTAGPSKGADVVSTPPVLEKKDAIQDTEAGGEGDVPPSPATSKKKKKKKKRKQVVGALDAPDGAAPNGGVNGVVPDSASPNGKGIHTAGDAVGLAGLDPSVSSSSLPKGEAARPATPSKTVSPSRVSQASLPRSDLPLLNLNGPPTSDVEEEVAAQNPGSGKKKRRRRRKNKMGGSGEGGS